MEPNRRMPGELRKTRANAVRAGFRLARTQSNAAVCSPLHTACIPVHTMHPVHKREAPPQRPTTSPVGEIVDREAARFVATSLSDPCGE